MNFLENKTKNQKNAKYVYILPKGYIHLLFYLFFYPTRSGAAIKSGLVHISPVHVLDKAILSHLWITKVHMNNFG